MSDNEVRYLPVVLSPREVLLKSDELARAVAAYDLREAQNKTQAKENGDVLKSIRARISVLADVVALKQESREVSGHWVRDGHSASWVRHDTGEVVETRGLTRDELQGDLDFDTAEEKH